MKKIIVPFVVLLIGITLTFYACKKENNLKTDKIVASPMSSELGFTMPTVSNGWLKFDSSSEYKDLIDYIHQNYTEDELPSFDQLISGFISLRKQYEIIDADTSDDRTKLTVDSLIQTNQILDCPDSWFASILSSDGYLQIGDTIFAFRPGNANGDAYAVPASYAEVVKTTEDLGSLPGTRVFQTSFLRFPFPRHLDDSLIVIHDTLNFPTICLYPTKPLTNWWGQKGGYI